MPLPMRLARCRGIGAKRGASWRAEAYLAATIDEDSTERVNREENVFRFAPGPSDFEAGEIAQRIIARWRSTQPQRGRRTVARLRCGENASLGGVLARVQEARAFAASRPVARAATQLCVFARQPFQLALPARPWRDPAGRPRTAPDRMPAIRERSRRDSAGRAEPALRERRRSAFSAGSPPRHRWEELKCVRPARARA